MGLDWNKLVEERNAWVAHNFPNEVDGHPGLGSMFGVIEEMGELVHAHLKEDQGIRGTDEQHQADAKDAVGDLTVYLLGLMHWCGAAPTGVESLSVTHFPSGWLLSLAESVGRLSEAFQDDDREEAEWQINDITIILRGYCKARGWSYVQIVEETWAKVRQRDWVEYPETGLPPEVAAERGIH